MRHQEPRSIAVLTLAIVACTHATARSQAKIEVDGTLHSFTAEQINVTTGTNEGWGFVLDKNSVVSYLATGGSDLVVPQLAVHFRAKFDERGNLAEPIRRLKVFTPRAFFKPVIQIAPPGAWDDDPVANAGDSKPKPSEAVEDKASGETDDASPPTELPLDRNQKFEPQSGVEYELIGMLVANRRGKIVVDCGLSKTLRGELAEEVSVSLDIQGPLALKVAKIGDRVVATGNKKTTPGLANGKSIIISPIEPATEEPEKKRSLSRRDRSEPSEPTDKSAE